MRGTKKVIKKITQTLNATAKDGAHRSNHVDGIPFKSTRIRKRLIRPTPSN